MDNYLEENNFGWMENSKLQNETNEKSQTWKMEEYIRKTMSREQNLLMTSEL